MGPLLWGTLYGGWNETEWLRSGLPTAGGDRPETARPRAARRYVTARPRHRFGRGRDAFRKALTLIPSVFNSSILRTVLAER